MDRTHEQVRETRPRRYEPYPEYKDSGVEWLGKIPAHWAVVRAKTITAEHKQGFYTELAYVDDGVKLVRITDIYDNAIVSFENMPFVHIPERTERQFRINEGDFLFARSGTIGRFGVIRQPERAVFASYLIRFKFKEIHHEFLRCFLCSKYFQESLIASLHGGANHNIHAENIKERWIVLPIPTEQNIIAAFLDRETAKIDVLVAKKERLIELLREKRTALITQAVTRGLDPNVPMKDSGVEWLDEIPAHWEVFPLRRRLFQEVGSIKIGPFGSQLKLETMTQEGFKVYGQEHVIARDFNRGNKYIDQAKFDELLVCEIHPKDIVVTMMGSSGRCALVPRYIERGIMDSHLLRIRLTNPGLESAYLCLLIDKAEYVRCQIEAFGKGAIMHGLNSGIIKSLVLAVPPSLEQVEILDFLDRETAKIDALAAKVHEAIDLLKEYRTALISAAVTGKTDVREEVE